MQEKTLHGGGGTMRINSMSMFSTALNALRKNQLNMEKSMFSNINNRMLI